jgi:hypothetical protein
MRLDRDRALQQSADHCMSACRMRYTYAICDSQRQETAMPAAVSLTRHAHVHKYCHPLQSLLLVHALAAPQPDHITPCPPASPLQLVCLPSLKQELVHWLALRDSGFNQLLELLPSDLQQDTHSVEEVGDKGPGCHSFPQLGACAVECFLCASMPTNKQLDRPFA